MNLNRGTAKDNFQKKLDALTEEGMVYDSYALRDLFKLQPSEFWICFVLTIKYHIAYCYIDQFLFMAVR